MKIKVASLLILSIAISLSSCKEEPSGPVMVSNTNQDLKLSLAQWSFNEELFSGKMTNQDFIRTAAEMGFTGVEYVSQFFQDKAEDYEFLDSLKVVAEEVGVKNVMIMVDNAGDLGELDYYKRQTVFENYKKWVTAAKYLGCSAIRVNAHGVGDAQAVQDACMESIGMLAYWAKQHNIDVMIENHGGWSSNGDWMKILLTRLKPLNVGALADPANWCYKTESGALWGSPCVETYDRYKGMKELMPFAKGVSIKTFKFDKDGLEPDIDYSEIMKIIKESGYTGYLGVEYEGEKLSSREGVEMTIKMIEKYL